MTVRNHPGNVYKVYKIFSLVLVCGKPSINGSFLSLLFIIESNKIYIYQYMIINYWIFKKP